MQPSRRTSNIRHKWSSVRWVIGHFYIQLYTLGSCQRQPWKKTNPKESGKFFLFNFPKFGHIIVVQSVSSNFADLPTGLISSCRKHHIARFRFKRYSRAPAPIVWFCQLLVCFFATGCPPFGFLLLWREKIRNVVMASVGGGSTSLSSLSVHCFCGADGLWFCGVHVLLFCCSLSLQVSNGAFLLLGFKRFHEVQVKQQSMV
jgi:hypothetical protein